MTDSEFLSWLRDRLIFVYGENPKVDFVLRLDEIVTELERKEQSWNRPLWDYGDELEE